MKFKSLQYTIMAYAGACILAIIVALVGYTLVTGARTQAQVNKGTDALFEKVIRERLISLADANVMHIQNDLEKPLNVAVSLAQLSALSAADPGVSVHLSRDEQDRIVRDAADKHPALLGAYIGWEPNAFAGDDHQFMGQPGHDSGGRFLPYWYRNASGALGQDILQFMESQKRSDSGVREGEYYLCPKETHQLCAVDPYAYEVDGKPILMTSFTAPIMANGKFQGIAGADLSVGFIQDALVKANQSLYQGAGQMALIAGNGAVIAYTKDATQVGKSINGLLDESELSNLKRVKVGEPLYDYDESHGHIELFLPFKVGQTSAQWTLMIQLPIQAALGEAIKLHADIKAQTDRNTFGMGLVGLAIAVIGLGALWLVSRSITRPLKQMVWMLEDIAQGEGDLTRRLDENRADELGAMAKGFNRFLAKLQGMITQVVSSVQKVSDASEHTAEIAIHTQQGVQKQQVEIDQVATAIQEMSATAQEVARSANQAAEAAGNADQSANHGRTIVQNSSDAISALAAEINRAVVSVEGLAKNSENITTILVSIRGIAEQTNLLALNAAIEAARAGEQGRGFAVVADEVRNLAGKTQQATHEIQTMIQQLQSGTQDVVQIMQASQARTETSVQQSAEAAAALTAITEAVSVITEMNIHIAGAAEEQSAVAEDINRNVTVIGMVATEVANGADQSSHASAELTQLAEQQRRLVNQFKV
ncbi:chemotaxis transducer [Pseudomonas asuensis]|uniref:Chemotaxis transducer n=2 Tax=Pseudomonas asuensis TaxID=1825787 RepID=A0ABQ2GLH8_9PSED|nr:methyl-accepting chemotaxis protein [Pseudomonas asuensis]GGM00986.1 chemotaxis transducer [Pseudomonas asuensis]